MSAGEPGGIIWRSTVIHGSPAVARVPAEIPFWRRPRKALPPEQPPLPPAGAVEALVVVEVTGVVILVGHRDAGRGGHRDVGAVPALPHAVLVVAAERRVIVGREDRHVVGVQRLDEHVVLV